MRDGKKHKHKVAWGQLDLITQRNTASPLGGTVLTDAVAAG